MKRIVPVFFMLPWIVAQAASAASYDYYPQSRLYLGGDYDPFHPDTAYLECITSEGVEAVDTQGAVDTQIRMMRLQKRQDLYQETDFSASLAGSALFFSGGASVEKQDQDAFQEDSFTWMILFRTDFGRFTLKDPKLRAGLDQLPSDEFSARCGSEVVTEATKSVMAYALFTLKNVSDTQIHQLDEKFQSSLNANFWSAELDQSYQSFLETAFATSEISLTLDALGGPGASKLAELLHSGEPSGQASSSGSGTYEIFNRIPHVLERYVQTLDSKNAVPISFNTQSLRVFRHGTAPTEVDFKNQQVASLYTLYEDAHSTASRLEAILYGPDASRYDLTPDERTALGSAYQSYAQAANTLFQTGRNCFNPALLDQCLVPAPLLLEVKWPTPATHLNECEAKLLKARDSGLISSDEYEIALRHHLVPVVGGWERCLEEGAPF